MKRISNRIHDEQRHAAPQVQYVDRIVEVSVPHAVEAQVIVPSEPIIVEKIVEVPMDVAPIKEWCQNRIDEQKKAHSKLLSDVKKYHQHDFKKVINELEMQRRALVSIKAQRDVDRKRRLQLIVRLKKERAEQQKLNLRCKLAIGASLLLSVLSLIIK